MPKSRAKSPHFLPISRLLHLMECFRGGTEGGAFSLHLCGSPGPSEPFAMGPVQFRRPRRVAENWFTKPGFWGAFCQFFLGKNSKTQSSLNFLQSGSRKFTKSDFSGLAPIWSVLNPFFVQQNEPFLHENLHRHEGNPLKHRLSIRVSTCAACPMFACKNLLVRLYDLRLQDKAGSQAPAAPGTPKRGQSA